MNVSLVVTILAVLLATAIGVLIGWHTFGVPHHAGDSGMPEEKPSRENGKKRVTG